MRFFLHGQRSVVEPGPTLSPWSIPFHSIRGGGASFSKMILQNATVIENRLSKTIQFLAC